MWVDTNTMLEVYSHGDIFDAGDTGDVAAVELRRMRMQGALWMAMALAQHSVHSVTYAHENVRNIRRMAPPGSNRGVYTSAVLYLLGDGGVFAGWEASATDLGEGLTNRERDRLMIDQCRDDGLILVSRDEEVVATARAEGVQALRPEEYGASVLTNAQARTIFMDRLRAAVDWYPTTRPASEHDEAIAAAQYHIDVYGRVWLPAR